MFIVQILLTPTSYYLVLIWKNVIKLHSISPRNIMAVHLAFDGHIRSILSEGILVYSPQSRTIDFLPYLICPTKSVIVPLARTLLRLLRIVMQCIDLFSITLQGTLSLIFCTSQNNTTLKVFFTRLCKVINLLFYYNLQRFLLKLTLI